MPTENQSLVYTELNRSSHIAEWYSIIVRERTPLVEKPAIVHRSLIVKGTTLPITLAKETF
jgi:hypothetical protein